MIEGKVITQRRARLLITRSRIARLAGSTQRTVRSTFASEVIVLAGTTTPGGTGTPAGQWDFTDSAQSGHMLTSGF